MFRKGMTQEEKDALWVSKVNAAQRFASHYNRRMRISANRWDHHSVHAGVSFDCVEFEYIVRPTDEPSRYKPSTAPTLAA